MATPGAEFVTLARKAQLTSTGNTEVELQELEKEIARSRDWPIDCLLDQVVSRVSSITHADGAAIAVRDQWGVICRASVGEAPEVGSRLRPDSALTRACFETGQVAVCEDAENDFRVHSSTANNLRLRSAVVVPLQNQGSVLGVIEILSSRPSAFSTTHIVGLQRIAQLLVTSLAFSPDGRLLVSGSWDKTIKIWDVEAGREIQTLAGHEHPVYSVAFDSRGQWVASGSEDGTIKLWRLAGTADHSVARP